MNISLALIILESLSKNKSENLAHFVYCFLASFPILLKSRNAHKDSQMRNAASVWIFKDIFDFPHRLSEK